MKVKKKISWQINRNEQTLISSVEENFKAKKTIAVIKVNVETFIIESAYINIDGHKTMVPNIIGTLGYIQGKKTLKRALKESPFEKYTDLFIQCISALIQAETYVYRERGYQTEEEYNRYWDLLEDNGCRMYSHSRKALRKGDLPWMSYVPDNFNKNPIFAREKNYEVISYQDESEDKTEDFLSKNLFGLISLKGHLKDDYHEMILEIITDLNCIVKNSKINFIKAPGKSCYSNKENQNNLKSLNLKEIEKHQIIDAFGGCDGCYHIVEMAIDMADVIKGSD